MGCMHVLVGLVTCIPFWDLQNVLAVPDFGDVGTCLLGGTGFRHEM